MHSRYDAGVPGLPVVFSSFFGALSFLWGSSGWFISCLSISIRTAKSDVYYCQRIDLCVLPYVTSLYA